jgi:hypothetical protein
MNEYKKESVCIFKTDFGRQRGSALAERSGFAPNDSGPRRRDQDKNVTMFLGIPKS